ncbi:hypothetical protein BHM03_00043149 [Ensete ventricosum]|nr:hypothetical protein BHM03_00043149 [Ensete ventricosum]
MPISLSGSPIRGARFAITNGTAHNGQYILVRQLNDMRTTRYQAVSAWLQPGYSKAKGEALKNENQEKKRENREKKRDNESQRELFHTLSRS